MDITIIYGPPGTGKTTQLLNIVEKELIKTPPNKIAYVSFTRQGTYEGKNRAMKKFNFTNDDFPYFRTLHSIAFRQANITRGKIISKENYKQFSKAMGMSFTGYYTEEFFHNDDQYIFFDILHRNNPTIAANYLYTLDVSILRYVRNNYKRFKQQIGILDFTDLIEMFCNKNESLPVDVAIIDEAQDLTTLQWKMIWIAFRNCKKIYIAGDDDQAIYEWSGADINQLMNIQGDQIILSQTYRLPRSIWDYSKTIVEMIQKRVSKNFKSMNVEGSINYIESLEELSIDNMSSWLFLSRNNCFLRIVEEHLRYKGLLYFKKGTCSANYHIIEAIKYYEAIRQGKSDKSKLYKLINYVTKNCTFKLPWYEVFNLRSEELSYYRDIFSTQFNFNNINIRLETIHSSKGSEADNVVLVTDVTLNVQRNLTKNTDSELRCYYVAITRSKKNLYLITPRTKYYYNFYRSKLNGN